MNETEYKDLIEKTLKLKFTKSNDLFYSVIYIDKLYDVYSKLIQRKKQSDLKANFVNAAININDILYIIKDKIYLIAARICEYKENIKETLSVETIKKIIIPNLKESTITEPHKMITDIRKNNPILAFLGIVLETVPGAIYNFVIEVCDNVYADQKKIQTFFCPKDYKIIKLRKLEIPENETHNKCKSPVYLTFEISNIKNNKDFKELKIVYKPRDVEIDCLIAGDCETLSQINGYQTFSKSLFQFINKEIKDKKLNVYLMPVYKILPIKYHSDPKVKNTNDLYGYTEYLYTSYDKDFKTSEKSKSLENRIFAKDRSKKEIIDTCKKFYSIFGQYFAIAQLFSITDQHDKNIVVHCFEPYLIDLEASCIIKTIKLTTKPNYDDRTNLIEAMRTCFKNENHLDLECEYKDITSMSIRSSQYKKNIIKYFDLMYKLYIDINDKIKCNFIDRIKNCCVRNVVYGTPIIQISLNMQYYKFIPEFSDYLQGKDIYWTPKNYVRLDYIIEKDYDAWKKNMNIEPRFIVLQKSFLKKSFKYNDYAVWRHVLNTTKVFDFEGTEIQIPNQMIIKGKKCVIEQRKTGNKDYYETPPIKINMIAYDNNKIKTSRDFLLELLYDNLGENILKDENKSQKLKKEINNSIKVQKCSSSSCSFQK